MSVRLFESLATTGPLADAFSDRALLAAMLRFEVALTRAEARAGVIPVSAADVIAGAAAADDFDPAALAAAARASGTPAIGFVEALTARVRTIDAAAAAFVHRGATSQDLTDTALVLCLVDALAILAADHGRLTTALRRLAEQHADTVMLGRTLLQPAPPITLGLKAAGWLAAAVRCHARVTASAADACILQFGGASGTLAALGDLGMAVGAELARELHLPLPDGPWHAHRDRLAALLAAAGIYTGTLGKLARDISLLMQHEVGEAAESGGGSSTMPHKRNPAGCATALAAATRVPGLVSAFLSGMVQEHERSVGGWHAEAPTVAAIIQATGAALASMADACESLSIDQARMRRNIDATHGFVFAERAMMLLAPRIGRDAADRLVRQAMESARRDDGNFVEVLVALPEVIAALDPTVRSSLGEPSAYLGSAETFRRRLLGNE